MADVNLTIQAIARSNDGLTEAFTAVNDTDNYFAQNDGRVFLHVKNTNVAAGTITVITPFTVDPQLQLAVTDPTATVPANTGDILFGPFPPMYYNDINGRIQATFSLATGMTVAAVRLP